MGMGMKLSAIITATVTLACSCIASTSSASDQKISSEEWTTIAISLMSMESFAILPPQGPLSPTRDRLLLHQGVVDMAETQFKID